MHLLKDLTCLLFIRDSVALDRTVHESDADTVCVEERSSERDSVEDELEVVDSGSAFFETHGTTVVKIEDDIEECKLATVESDLFGKSPLCGESVQHARLNDSTGNWLEAALRVEGLKFCVRSLAAASPIKLCPTHFDPGRIAGE